METASATVGGIVFASEGACFPSPDWRLRPNELGRFAQKFGVEMKWRSPRSGDWGGVAAYFICSEFQRGGGGRQERWEGRKREKRRADAG